MVTDDGGGGESVDVVTGDVVTGDGGGCDTAQ